MNDDRSFERFVADNVGGLGPTPMPEDFYDDMHAFASDTRQRPEWLALIKEPPMRTNARLTVGSPTARVAAIMAATLLLAVALAAAGIAGQRLFAAGGPIVVAQDGTGDYTTITEAVAAAVDGDEILVRRGTYAESIVIDKDISLLGEDRDSVVIEYGVGCTIDDFSESVVCPEGTPAAQEVQAGGQDFVLPTPIRLHDTTAEIGDLTVRTGNRAIEVDGGAPLIRDVHADVAEASGNGIVILGHSAATVRDSEVFSLAVDDLSPAMISGNTIFVVHANDDEETTSSEAGPTFSDNDLGVMQLSGPVFVEGNRFPASMTPDGFIDGFSDTGIEVISGSGWTLRDNVIRGKGTGIRALADGVLEGNVIEGNEIGLYYPGVPPAMSGNRICENSDLNVLALDDSFDRTTNEVCVD